MPDLWHCRHCLTLADYRNSRRRPPKPGAVDATMNFGSRPTSGHVGSVVDSWPEQNRLAGMETECVEFSAVAALRPGRPGQLTWLEGPPPWLCPACDS
jgi:rubredoxin